MKFLGLWCGILVGTFSLSLTGCVRNEPLTAEEERDQDARMRYFLDETSPRNSNNHPKVNDIFVEKFQGVSSRKKPTPSKEDCE